MTFTIVPDPHLDPWDPYVLGLPDLDPLDRGNGSEDPDLHPDPYQNVTDPQTLSLG
jgi:hypothetical protein